MKILLTAKTTELLKRELRKAGRREIGGLLMGEHIGEEVFRVVEISVQRSGGDAACFTRHPREHSAQLDSFFERHGNDYSRFNYLGEWHSHPSFPVIPSTRDVATMASIVEDPEVGANFLVLLIVKAVGSSEVELSATMFLPDASPKAIDVDIEAGSAAPMTAFDWFRSFFS